MSQVRFVFVARFVNLKWVWMRNGGGCDIGCTWVSICKIDLE